MNPTKHHVRAAGACQRSNFVAAECVRSVDTYTNNIARLNLVRIHCFEGLIDQAGISEGHGCCRR